MSTLEYVVFEDMGNIISFVVYDSIIERRVVVRNIAESLVIWSNDLEA